jgi:hypothetical protein
MAFMKWRSENAYVSGAIKTALTPAGLAMKLNRHKISAMYAANGLVELTFGHEKWFFGEWEPDGVGSHLVWMRPCFSQYTASFSARLAIHGIRHRFEVSSPRDDQTDDVRAVTRYEFRWHGFESADSANTVPAITQFEEQL